MESVETLEEALETFWAFGAVETHVSDGKNKSGYFMIESGHQSEKKAFYTPE